MILNMMMAFGPHTRCFQHARHENMESNHIDGNKKLHVGKRCRFCARCRCIRAKCIRFPCCHDYSKSGCLIRSLIILPFLGSFDGCLIGLHLGVDSIASITQSQLSAPSAILNILAGQIKVIPFSSRWHPYSLRVDIASDGLSHNSSS